MDIELIYTLVGVVIFAAVGLKILLSDVSMGPNDEEATKSKIIDAYRKELYEALLPLKKDKEARIAKKNELLNKFSVELISNIYFDEFESKEIIVSLASDF